MSKDNLTSENWAELYDSLVNSVGRATMESILVNFIVDPNDNYGDIESIVEKMGLQDDRDKFIDSVKRECSKLSNDQLASLVFDAIAMDGDVDKFKNFSIGEHKINTDEEKLKQTVMLLDMHVTQNAPHTIRDWYEDIKININFLKFMKGDTQLISLSEGEDLLYSRDQINLFNHDVSGLDEEQLNVIDALKSELLKQIEKVAETSRQMAVDKKNSKEDWGVDL